MRLMALSLLLLCFSGTKAQPGNYAFSKQITIDSAQIEGSIVLANFPMLFSVTDTNLRHVDAGGHVRNPEGFDIVFTEGDCNTLLKHQVERYDSASGELVAWVRLLSLNPNLNNVIYLFYGDSAISVNPSTDSTFTSEYLAVYHLNGDFTDASLNAYTGTINGSTNNAASKIAAGRTFVDPNHWIELTTLPNLSSSFTVSAWLNTSDRTENSQRIVCDDETNANGGYALSLGDPGAGRVRFYIRGLNPVSLDSPTGGITNGTWHYVVGVFDEGNSIKRLYVDGAQVASQSITGTFTSSDAGDASIGGETATGETGNRFDGSIDEARFQNTVRSAAWIATEYNNQNNPSNFYSLGAEQSANPCTPLSLEWIRFELTKLNKATLASAQYLSSKQANRIGLEFSADMNSWIQVGEISPEQGNSSVYFMDEIRRDGTHYYRLRFDWMDGSFQYSETRFIEHEMIQSSDYVFRRKSRYMLELQLKSGLDKTYVVRNLMGQEFELQAKESDESSLVFDLRELAVGYYLISLGAENYRFVVY